MISRAVIIPDPQARPGAPLDPARWAGEYCVDKKPELIVVGGDVFDMHSLSSYDEGKKGMEGRRYRGDIEAGHEWFDEFEQPIVEKQNRQWASKHKVWNPRLVYLKGNHEDRIRRYVDDHPKMAGTMDVADTDRDGWENYGFLEIVEIEGVKFSHYFQNTKSSRPLGGMMETRIKSIGGSFVAFHEQGRKFGTLDVPGGRYDGLVVGSYYAHDEEYRGPQSNGEWRGIVVLHELVDGTFDPMFVSIGWLCRRYEGIEWGEYRRKHGLV